MTFRMNTFAFPRTLGLAALLAFTVGASAQSLVRYESQPGSKMRMDGTSNIHDWHAESQLIGGYIEVDGALIESPDKLKPGKVEAKAIELARDLLRQPSAPPRLLAVFTPPLRFAALACPSCGWPRPLPLPACSPGCADG